MNELLFIIKEIVSVAKDIVLAFAAIVASYVGIKGLGTWRRQLKGNAEYKSAKNMPTAIYELREAIASVRNPIMYFSQEPDLPEEKLSALSDREKQWHALTQAYQKRWDSVSTAKAKLDANLLEAEAVWGSEITVKITPLNKMISELFWSIKDHLEAQNPSPLYENPAPEDMKKLRKIIYSRGNI